MVEFSGMRSAPDKYAAIDMLMQSVKNGSRKDFARLFAATSGKVGGIVRHILQDKSDAEEVFQEVFIQIWTKSHLYEPGLSHAECWISHIARNAAIDHLRRCGRRPRRVEFTDDWESEEMGPEAAAILSSDWRKLSNCLDQLAPDRLQAIRRIYLDGASYEDMSSELALPMNTLKSWLRRSLLNLKSCMSQKEEQGHA